MNNANETKKRRVKFAACILELVYILVLGALLGNRGITFLIYAMEIFWFLWSITGYALDDVLGKLLRGKIAKGQYKNAAKMKRNTAVFQVIVGLLSGLAILLGAGFVGENILGFRFCVPILCILAPVLPVRMLSSLISASFQGDGNELPTVVSVVIRQLLLLLFGVLFVLLFEGYGAKTADLLKLSDFKAMYGAMGAACAYFVSELVTLGYLILYSYFNKKREKRGTAEGMRMTDTFAGQLKVLLSNLVPVNVQNVLIQLPIWISLFFYIRYAAGTEAAYDYGILLGKWLPVMGIIILPAMMLLLDNTGKVALCIRKEERRYARGNFRAGMHIGVIYGGFMSVYLFVFAPQLSDLFQTDSGVLLDKLFRAGALILLFWILSFYFTEILLKIGGKTQILAALLVWNILSVILFLVFLNTNKMGVLAVAYGLAISGAVYLTITGWLLVSQTKMNIDWLQGVTVPLGTACVIGLMMMFADKFMAPHLGSLLTVCLNLILGYLLYMICLLLIGNFSEQEFSYMPAGSLIKKIAELFRAI